MYFKKSLNINRFKDTTFIRKVLSNMKKVKVVGNVPSNTNCNLYVFKSQFFKDKELRVVKNEGECYLFVATDIAKILDYKQIDKISKTIVEEKNKTNTMVPLIFVVCFKI